MREKLKYNKKGFTLIEIFIAITVISIGITGAYAVLPVLIKNQAINADKFLASQIANEGLELIRNLRDSLWLADASWSRIINCGPGCDCSSQTGCEIDYNDPGLSFSQGRLLQIDPNSGFYNYGAGAYSQFKRKITAQEFPEFLKIKVEVSWNSSHSPFVAEENFYDWR